MRAPLDPSPPPSSQDSTPQQTDPEAGARRRLTFLTAARLALYAVLLAAAAAFYLQGDRVAFPESSRFVTVVLGAAFAAAGLYAAWLRTGRALRKLAWTQVVVDQLIWTALVYISGGPLSGATTFYGLSCVLAAVTLGFEGAMATAGLGGALYGLIVGGFSTGLLRLPPDQPPFVGKPGQFVYPALVTLVGLLVVALLSGYLARRLQAESARVAEATRRAERAERLAALGRVAAALAHEIRNPLGSISGAIDIVREAPGLGVDEKRLCEIIRRETDRRNDVGGDGRNLARPRAPAMDVVDLARIASDVVQLARRSGRAGGDVPVEYQGAERLDVRADAGQLRQLVWNLVRNAVQASEAGTKVVVRASRAGREAVIEVIDRGAGVPESMRDRIFDAFLTTRAQGVGIGLAVVKQIVDAHGGKVQVLDGEGGGTVFRVELRAAGEPTPAPAGAEEVEAARAAGASP